MFSFFVVECEIYLEMGAHNMSIKGDSLSVSKKKLYGDFHPL